MGASPLSNGARRIRDCLASKPDPPNPPLPNGSRSFPKLEKVLFWQLAKCFSIKATRNPSRASAAPEDTMNSPEEILLIYTNSESSSQLGRFNNIQGTWHWRGVTRSWQFHCCDAVRQFFRVSGVSPIVPPREPASEPSEQQPIVAGCSHRLLR